MKLYQTSTIKPYILDGQSGWLYTRTEKDRIFYLHKYEAVGDAKKDLYNDVIDYLITYTKHGNADYSGFGPRGRKLCDAQRDYDKAEWRAERWYKLWSEAKDSEYKYKKLYEKQQKVIDSLKEIFT